MSSKLNIVAITAFIKNSSKDKFLVVKRHKNEMRIIRVCEYSLIENNSTILEGKHLTFSIDKKRISQFLDHASLLFLLPLPPEKNPLQQMRNRSKVTILRMSFYRKQFRYFILDRIYKKIPKNKL